MLRALARRWALRAIVVLLGVEGGLPPRQPLQGITRSVAPKGRLANAYI